MAAEILHWIHHAARETGTDRRRKGSVEEIARGEVGVEGERRHCSIVVKRIPISEWVLNRDCFWQTKCGIHGCASRSFDRRYIGLF